MKVIRRSFFMEPDLGKQLIKLSCEVLLASFISAVCICSTNEYCGYLTYKLINVFVQPFHKSYGFKESKLYFLYTTSCLLTCLTTILSDLSDDVQIVSDDVIVLTRKVP